MPIRHIYSRRRVFLTLGLAAVAALAVSVSIATGECSGINPPVLKVTPGERNFVVNKTQTLTVENTGGGTLKISLEEIEPSAKEPGEFVVVEAKGCINALIGVAEPCIVTIECKKAGGGKYEVMTKTGMAATATLKCT